MREGFAVFFSVVTATLAPALVFAVYALAISRSFIYVPSAFLLAAIIAFVHALILGVPAALALVHQKRFRLLPMSLAGAVVGFLPLAVTSLFSPPNGWLSFLPVLGSAAALGSVGGVAFYLTHQAMCPNNSFKPKPLRGSA